ncbi:DUF5670 family protein [Arthrobacter sp. MI7-26]|uniref:DUF5670 family protein n=1 Tax=Arthrobacter sp. MI7-26 TaxID=2993653 RepID=UPI003A5990C5
MPALARRIEVSITQWSIARAVILAVLWLLGLLGSTGGGFIHLQALAASLAHAESPSSSRTRTDGPPARGVQASRLCLNPLSESKPESGAEEFLEGA